MIVKEIKPAGSNSALEKYAKRHNLVFHSADFLSCYPVDSVTQCAVLNNNYEVIGCFLYFSFRKARIEFVISPPWMPDIALHFDNPAESVVGRSSFIKDMMHALASYFAGMGKSFISVNLPVKISDTQPFIWKGFASRVRHTYLVDLSLPEPALKGNLSSEKRKSLNKAEKDRLSVIPGLDGDTIFHLVRRSLNRSGKDKNLTIAGAVIRKFVNTMHSISFVAYNGPNPIAASFCIVDGDRALYLFGGYDDVGGHHGAGVSCMWRSMLEAKNRGLRVFDFEGSMDPDIERYFREFGGQLVPYQCVEKIRPVLKLLLRLKGQRAF